MQNQLHEPRLIFNFYKPQASIIQQQYGTLILESTLFNLKFQATSGLRGYQRPEQSYLVGKGAIPPHQYVGIDCYRVSLKPLHMPGVRGVEGNFYPILPYKNLVNIKGMNAYRGDFGIHRDANVVGTAGCIGITVPNHWNLIEEKFEYLRQFGWLNIPLLVPAIGESIFPKK